jgi:hypothetical protein
MTAVLARTNDAPCRASRWFGVGIEEGTVRFLQRLGVPVRMRRLCRYVGQPAAASPIEFCVRDRRKAGRIESRMKVLFGSSRLAMAGPTAQTIVFR